MQFESIYISGTGVSVIMNSFTDRDFILLRRKKIGFDCLHQSSEIINMNMNEKTRETFNCSVKIIEWSLISSAKVSVKLLE